MNEGIGAFNSDVKERGEFVSSLHSRLSCYLSDLRMIKAITDSVDLKDYRVIDVGCGTGLCTRYFLESMPESILGIDAAEEAIALAKKRYAFIPNMAFEKRNIYELARLKSVFDIAIVKGVFHHLHNIPLAVQNVCATSNVLVTIEPNGYNLAVRLIQKVSPFHRRHGTKAFFPDYLRGLLKENGFSIVSVAYIGLVPKFCPNRLSSVPYNPRNKSETPG